MFELKPLELKELAPYFEDLWEQYRAEFIAAGFSEGYADESVEHSKKSFFPEQILAPGNSIFYAFDNGNKVGKLWLFSIVREGKTEWSIYDIETFGEYRGKGFGRKIMLAAEDFVRKAGGNSISLSVFGNNSVARGLYESLNYQTIRVGMKKLLQ
ncbi:MAG: GNAT family N-acetyltransferase [Candidatus Planktophila sp.]